LKGAWLEDLTWPEAAERIAAGHPILVPVGARAKEHGHHLPLQTDYLLARALCDRVAAALPVLIAPVVDFGYYPAFTAYPGSQHLSAATFIALMEEIVEGFLPHQPSRLAIVNTGVSTEAPIRIAVRNLLARHGVEVAVADITRLGRATDAMIEQALGGHADEHETSLMLAIAPERVRLERATPDYGCMRETPATVFYRPTRFSGAPAAGMHYSATGARGDPTLATVEKGRAILAAMVADLVDGLQALRAPA
jgi:creatinine amidohydrolase